MSNHPKFGAYLANLLALNRTVVIVLLSVLFFGLGENLWRPFMPAYLKDIGAPSGSDALTLTVLLKVGVYACLLNLFEGFCYIGGGQITARLGDRGSLLFFGVLTIAGYGLFLVTSHALGAIVGALLILGWEPLSVPVTFTTVGSTVRSTQQGMAFAIQSIQKRLPKMIGPVLAGHLLTVMLQREGEAGRVIGMQLLVSTSLLLAVATLLVQSFWMPHREPVATSISAGQILGQLHPTLRRLLLAEVFTRWCDWLVREYVVLYVLWVRGLSDRTFGWWLAVTHLTALLTYLPIGRLTQTVGLQPFIGLTFIFFALFPLTLAVMPNDWLVLAFVIYGLREIGEPARKALITSLFPEAVRAQGVGFYWGLRSFAICWSALVGALVWTWLGPEGLLYVAFGLGCVGAGVFYGWCRVPPPAQRDESPS